MGNRTTAERTDTTPPSGQELELIEVLREWIDEDENDNRLEIERSGGAWEVTLSMPLRRKTARGVGKTFAEAWDNVAPSWA
jgi:hypothetical protein